jgi:hypothetical protein
MPPPTDGSPVCGLDLAKSEQSIVDIPTQQEFLDRDIVPITNATALPEQETGCGVCLEALVERATPHEPDPASAVVFLRLCTHLFHDKSAFASGTTAHSSNATLVPYAGETSSSPTRSLQRRFVNCMATHDLLDRNANLNLMRCYWTGTCI